MPNIRTFNHQPHCGRTDFIAGDYFGPAVYDDQAFSINHALERGDMMIDIGWARGKMDDYGQVAPLNFVMIPGFTHFFIEIFYRIAAPAYVGALSSLDGVTGNLLLELQNFSGSPEPIWQSFFNYNSYLGAGNAAVTGYPTNANAGGGLRIDTIVGAYPSGLFINPPTTEGISLRVSLDYPGALPTTSQPTATTNPETGEVFDRGGVFGVKLVSFVG